MFGIISLKYFIKALLMVNYNQTCARFLIFKAEEQFKDDIERTTMIKDIYIKVKSYAFLNKLLFLISVAFVLSIFIFPSWLVLDNGGISVNAFHATILQSILTVITGGSIYLYKDYKEKQTNMEVLLRKVFYLESFSEKDKEEIIKNIRSIDVGFKVSNFLNKC